MIIYVIRFIGLWFINRRVFRIWVEDEPWSVAPVSPSPLNGHVSVEFFHRWPDAPFIRYLCVQHFYDVYVVQVCCVHIWYPCVYQLYMISMCTLFLWYMSMLYMCVVNTNLYPCVHQLYMIYICTPALYNMYICTSFEVDILITKRFLEI